MAACIFCDIIEGRADATIVYEDASALGFFPRPEGRLADGHVLVVPRHHVSDLFQASAADLQAVIRGMQRVAEALRAALGASGVNILSASGPNSGQSVFHLHFHVIPRWAGDGLSAWPKGRSTHRVSRDSAALIRDWLAAQEHPVRGTRAH